MMMMMTGALGHVSCFGYICPKARQSDEQKTKQSCCHLQNIAIYLRIIRYHLGQIQSILNTEMTCETPLVSLVDTAAEVSQGDLSVNVAIRTGPDPT